jgi:hypothetical protein
VLCKTVGFYKANHTRVTRLLLCGLYLPYHPANHPVQGRGDDLMPRDGSNYYEKICLRGKVGTARKSGTCL